MMTTDDRLLTRELLASYDVARLLTTLVRQIARDAVDTAQDEALDLIDDGEFLSDGAMVTEAVVDNSERAIWECAVRVVERMRAVRE